MPGFKKRIPGNDDVIEGTFGKTRSPGDLINYLHFLLNNKSGIMTKLQFLFFRRWCSIEPVL